MGTADTEQTAKVSMLLVAFGAVSGSRKDAAALGAVFFLFAVYYPFIGLTLTQPFDTLCYTGKLGDMKLT